LTTIFGLPAHALLNHAIVVLAPLVALLEILCAVWPAARRRLVWLNLALAVAVMVLTPLTTSAGEWLYNQQSEHSAILETHQLRGEWAIYIAVALLVVAVVQVVQHWMESRSQEPKRVLAGVAAVLALAVGVSSIVGVVLIGDAGAQAVWGERE
jgi:ABC-type branched-subunit amino acid transport system permease subunit